MNSSQDPAKPIATLSPKNRLALALLREWMADQETDEDDAKMKEFEMILQENRIVFTPPDTIQYLTRS